MNNLKDQKKIQFQKEFLGSYEQAAQYLKDNHYIRSGYRVNYNSYKKSLQSCFHCQSNEFSNIWSHVIGVIIVIIMIFFLYNYHQKEAYVNHVQQQIQLLPKNYKNLVKELYNKFYQENKQLYFLKTIIIQLNNIFSFYIQYQLYQNILNNVQELQNTHLQILDQFQIYKQKQQNKQEIQTKVNMQQFQKLIIIIIISFFYQKKKENIIKLKKQNQQVSVFPILLFLISSMICLSGSILFHTFNCISKKHCDFLLRIDYGGICIIIGGGSYPCIYYGFFCEQNLMHFYSYFNLILCFSVFIVSLFDFLHQEKYRNFKGLLYGSLGTVTSVPLIHLIIKSIYANNQINDYLFLEKSVPYYFGTAIFLIIGLCTYLARCPERFKPGKFDQVCNSHNLWHICVIIGVVFCYFAGIENYFQRVQTQCFI
ncbi:hypothetical protein IMG5_076560 [Ichthyophthirius multifiliis]|uniref:Uncharacterized protein n=1 Tax=Ichthyophthirius multifiliis TaxID=5932 RepID=G0QQ66_ICHMU|nr:hypothetical protein IMG5_076560 [Ichthyophthirius multifiliis]EGR32626.1 hypothetical protein IMG5_076560 [Ichthyophthirius multifiliis]|eukprot:XP_004036612.1 hypothetical protein IMG5_076560 [Ichthyophthirius multifiliis]